MDKIRDWALALTYTCISQDVLWRAQYSRNATEAEKQEFSAEPHSSLLHAVKHLGKVLHIQFFSCSAHD